MNETLKLIQEYGYIVLFLYSLGGGFFAIVGAGILSFMGVLDFKTSLAVGVASNFVGDVGLFYFGRYGKKEVHYYLKKHRRKLAYSHILIKKYGTESIFIQKFIYGIKTLIPIVIGLTKYDIKKFIFYNFFASLIFVTIFLYVGFIGGQSVISFANKFPNYPYFAPFFLVGILLVLNFYLNKVTKRGKQ